MPSGVVRRSRLYFLFIFILYKHIKYLLLNILKTKRDTNQQDLKIVDLYFVKSV